MRGGVENKSTEDDTTMAFRKQELWVLGGPSAAGSAHHRRPFACVKCCQRVTVVTGQHLGHSGGKARALLGMPPRLDLVRARRREACPARPRALTVGPRAGMLRHPPFAPRH